MLFGGKEVTRVYTRIVLLKHKLTRSKEDSMGLGGGSLFGPNSVSANTTQKEINLHVTLDKIKHYPLASNTYEKSKSMCDM